MTVTTHIAEILRQGIWASLTGGWYYEPSHSIFCNTVHLYVWLTLLIIPLVVGLVTSGEPSLLFLIGYTAFIGFVFMILKALVWYLHVIFDTSEPIITTKTTAEIDSDHVNRVERGSPEVPDGGIEMREIRRTVDRRSETRSRLIESSSRHSSRRRVRIELETRDDALPLDVSDVEMEFREHGTVAGREVTEEQRAKIEKALEALNEKFDQETPRDDSSLMVVDSDSKMAEMAESEEQSFLSKEERPLSKTRMLRKLSEPTFPVDSDNWIHGSDRRRSSDTVSRVRRANSTFESRNHGAKEGVLSEASLVQARQNTNKSYPSKISSDDEFHPRKLTKKQDLVASSTSDNVENSEMSVSEMDPDNEVAHYTSDWKDSSTRVFGPQEGLRSTSGKDSSRPLPVLRAGTPIDPKLSQSKHMEYDEMDVPSTSTGWVPVVVSLNDSDRPSSSSVTRLDERPGPSDSSLDIKGEITKFLEDLIDKHPETLDAIESVRQNRMGRAVKSLSSSSRNTGSRRRSSSSTVSALSDLALRDGTHIASGHEDTSQGAVHSFQDNEGNWWTYAFDEQGTETAQPLGSASALMEMIHRERSSGPVNSRTLLDVLPESAYASSEEDVEQHPSTSQTGKVVQSTRRERALSSSSNESYTYIPSVPTSIFHAGSGTGASRGPRNQMVSFVNVASRLRSAVRQPMEDRQRQGELDQIMDLLDRRSGSVSHSDRRRSTSSLQGRMMDFQERMFHMDNTSTGGSHRRLFQELGSAYRASEFGGASSRRTPAVKKSYYYRMKMFPKTDKSLKLKMDRLSVSALFDRNRGIGSCVFDTILACCVATLAGLVMSTGIYYDLSLFFFAFVVAGAHFSLLKSVQPDASSPIHGFNWLVAYSRPVYFCILCILLLTLHRFCNDPNNTKIPWNWNPYRLNDASPEMVLLAFRDFVSFLIIFLPVSFTFGWLPQVNTLTHHILEQIEMHFFGGTASISVLSSFLQLLKSLSAWTVLVILCQIAFATSPSSTQAPAFSAFLAVSVGLSYLLSRFSSNPQLAVTLIQSISDWVKRWVRHCRNRAEDEDLEEEKEIMADPLPERLKRTLTLRAKHDLLFTTVIVLAVFGFHSTSVFSATRPYFIKVITPLCLLVSVFNHYIYLQLRSHTPWKLLSNPVLRSGEFNVYECSKEARLMGFERIHVWLQTLERNLLFPMLVMCQLSDAAWSLPAATYLAPLIALRLLRGGFSHPQMLFVPLVLSFIATRFDWAHHLPFGIAAELPQPALFVLCYYILTVIYPKWLELYLKILFIMAYVAPWQISWGSAFHAFAQPFSVPHSALIWAQTIVSSVLSAPLNPFLGSSFFMISYVRPVKFWERDYNTKRCDASNTRLASQIDRGPMLDDSNLNAVFYEHLTRSLQKSLAGDLLMGRWATSVQPGDCFILASFYLNCLVHIVEVGNGFVTFQLRGLEFRGTYCHQREVEAISEDQAEGAGCCCCSPGSLPGFLSLNTAWSLRWLAWEVVAAKYVIDGYSITDNSAVNLLQVHELRRLLVTLYVKCIIYYASTSPKLISWLNNEAIQSALVPVIENSRYADVDHMFGPTNDEDYDNGAGGISKASFCEWYSQWIMYCLSVRRENSPEEQMNNEDFLCLCYLLSLLGRRALGTASHNRHSTAAESFLYGLHALFKGDFRIQCQRDEWVFADMDLLRLVISPAVKMALKLHQDHFAALDDFEEVESLYKVIADHQTKLFISHEQDPAWRRAILSNTSSLLALRHMYDDGQDDYKIIMLNKMHLNMRVIKLNRECVRAFWAGQQQELIYLRNRNPERGSIQNARQVLRNMINSSADQPVGYPIYVSPLTTSFVDTHSQINRILGPTITLGAIGSGVRRAWRSLVKHVGPSTSSQQGGCAPPPPPPSGFTTAREQEDRTSQSSKEGHLEQSIVQMSSDGTAKVSLARLVHADTPTVGKKLSNAGETPPGTIVKRVSFEGIPQQEEDAKSTDTERDLFSTQLDEQGKPIWLEIHDLEQIFKYLNEPLKSTGQPLVDWPSEDMRQMASYKSWFCQPVVGMPGRVIHTWYPNHMSKKLRSHIGDVIYLLSVPEMANALIAISERGCRRLTEKEVKRIRARIDPPECGENDSCIDRPRPRIRRLRQPSSATSVPLSSDTPCCSSSQQ